MRKPHLLLTLLFLLSLALVPLPAGATASLDYDIANGHFYTQTNGQPLGTTTSGYSVTNEAGVPFWDAYQQMGGPTVLGYPVTKRFSYDGFVTQAMQKMVFQWRPDTKQVVFLNTFDALHDKDKDDWLLVYRQTPKPFDTSPDNGLSWDAIVKRHQAFLDQNEPIKKVYFSDPYPVDHYGLPVATADMGNSFVIRAQRATFQYWKEDVPWAKKGDVSVANGGDLAKEAGLWPDSAISPETAPPQPVVLVPSSTSPAPDTATPTPTPTRQPMDRPIPAAGSNAYKAKSPEYGMNIFLWGNPTTTQRDLQKVLDARFNWQKTLFQWRWIEPVKNQFHWTESDRLVKASTDAGVKIIARLDFQPNWARSDSAQNGPPDDPQDFSNFVYALVDRYKSGSPYGHIDAVEIWNEPNLSREWGDKKPDAAQYVQLLKAGYEGAKRADPSVTVITAGLTPTGTWNNEATPDDLFLQQMYDAGAKAYFDVLGAHGAGFKAPPEMSPEAVAANPSYGGHRFFCFRRVEDLRAVMVKNGDSNKQVWLLEFGWTSDEVHPAYAWHKVTEQQKADYIVGAYKWAASNWSPWIGVMTLWNLPDPSWGTDREEYWWSIANNNGTDRPAFTKLKESRQSGYLP